MKLVLGTTHRRKFFVRDNNDWINWALLFFSRWCPAVSQLSSRFSEQINEIKGFKMNLLPSQVYKLEWMKTDFLVSIENFKLSILDPFLSSLDWKINWNLFAVEENSFFFFRVLVFISYRTQSNRILNCILCDCPRVWCLSNFWFPKTKLIFNFRCLFRTTKNEMFFCANSLFSLFRFDSKKSCKI